MNVYLADVSISPGGIWSIEYFIQRLTGLCLQIKFSSQNEEPGWECRHREEAAWVEERQGEELAGN